MVKNEDRRRRRAAGTIKIPALSQETPPGRANLNQGRGVEFLSSKVSPKRARRRPRLTQDLAKVSEGISGASRPRAVTFSTDAIRPSRTRRAESKLFTVGQMWRGRR